MAEPRKKSMSVLLGLPGRKGFTKLELFDAAQWPEQPNAEHGLFRVRRDGRWIGGEEKYVFFTMSAVAGLLARALDDPDLVGLESEPGVRYRDRVRYAPTDPDRAHVSFRTAVSIEPWQGMDGRWRCLVMGVREPVLCSDLEVVD